MTLILTLTLNLTSFSDRGHSQVLRRTTIAGFTRRNRQPIGIFEGPSFKDVKKLGESAFCSRRRDHARGVLDLGTDNPGVDGEMDLILQIKSVLRINRIIHR